MLLKVVLNLNVIKLSLRGTIVTWKSGRGEVDIATPRALHDTVFGLFEKIQWYEVFCHGI
jgi:hypothetical protein